MTTFEIILTSLIPLLTGGNVVQYFMWRSAKKKADAEAQEIADTVIIKRVEFLEQRISRMEKLVCFRAEKCEQKL